MKFPILNTFLKQEGCIGLLGPDEDCFCPVDHLCPDPEECIKCLEEGTCTPFKGTIDDIV